MSLPISRPQLTTVVIGSSISSMARQTLETSSARIYKSAVERLFVEDKEFFLLGVILASLAIPLALIFIVYLYRRRRNRMRQEQYDFGNSVEQLSPKYSNFSGPNSETSASKPSKTQEQSRDVSKRSVNTLGGDEFMRTASAFDLAEIDEYVPAAVPAGTTTYGNDTTVVGTIPLSIPGFLEIQDSDVRRDKQIGKGGSGILYSGTLLVKNFVVDEDSSCAIKVLKDVEEDKDERQKRIFFQEVAIMHYFAKHPNFVTFLAFMNQPRAIVMKYYPQGSLNKLVSKKRDTPVDKWCVAIAHITIDVLIAISELHKFQIVHNDIKPPNILVDKNKQLKRYVGVLCDFSISTVNGSALMGVKEFQVAKVKGASWAYAAPEVLQRLYLPSSSGSKLKALIPDRTSVNRLNDDSYKIDVYSFAITMFESLNRTRAWGKSVAFSKDQAKKIVSGDRPVWSPELIHLRKESSHARKICEAIESAWASDPRSRPSADTLIARLK